MRALTLLHALVLSINLADSSKLVSSSKVAASIQDRETLNLLRDEPGGEGSTEKHNVSERKVTSPTDEDKQGAQKAEAAKRTSNIVRPRADEVPEDVKEIAEGEERLRRTLEKAMGARNSDEHEPRRVVGVSLNGKNDLGTLKSSFTIGIFGAVAILILFAWLRHTFPHVYLRMQLCSFCPDSPEQSEAGREFDYLLDAGRKMGYLDFLYQVWYTCPEDEVRLAGLDGWALLEFCRMNTRIISVIGPLLSCALLPMHYYASMKAHKNMDWLSRLDVGAYPKEDWVLWVHAVCVWLVVMVACWQITYAHESFVQRRYQWLANIPRPRATTVMVTNIPVMYRSDRALKDYFSSLFPESSVERSYVVRKTTRLPRLVQQLEDARYWTKVVQQQLQRDDASVKEEDTADYERCKLRSESLVTAVRREQELVEAAVGRGDLKVCSSSGFVTFNSELTQRQALREQFTREATEFIMLAPPEPEDVLYQNLAEDEMNAESWGLVGFLSLMAVFVFWVPIVVIISGWITLSSIQGQVPVLRRVVENYPMLEQLLSGVLATAALKLFMSLLPTILYSIIESTFHLKSGAQCQLKLQQWNTAFLLLFVVMVTSLGRGLTITAVIIAKEPAKVISLLASSLPSASHFYFSYVILGWIAMPAEMLRLANLTKFLWFTRVSSFGEEEAKQYSEPEHAASYGMGTRMSMLMLVSATTILFASCSPLILVFTMVYFLLAQVVYGYLLIFGESKKPDMGGLFWLQSLEILFIVLFFYVLLMVGVLRLLSKNNNWLGPPLMAAAAIMLLYGAWRRVQNLAFHTLPLEEVARAAHDKETHCLVSAEASPAKRRASVAYTMNHPVSSYYIQPECDPSVVEEK